MQIKINRVFGLLLITLLISQPAIAANKAFTNEDIYHLLGESKEFKNSLSVMTQQRERMNTILNAFLLGDTKTINEKSDEILANMDQIIKTQAITHGNESRVWQSVTEIVKETHLLKEETSKNNYEKAYEHFSNIAAGCIQCHQAVREWNKFPTPESQERKAASPLNK